MVDDEYGIQISLRLIAAAACAGGRVCLVGAPSVRGATYAGGGMASDGSIAACDAACIAASWDMINAARAASGGIGAAAEEADPPI